MSGKTDAYGWRMGVKWDLAALGRGGVARSLVLGGRWRRYTHASPVALSQSHSRVHYPWTVRLRTEYTDNSPLLYRRRLALALVTQQSNNSPGIATEYRRRWVVPVGRSVQRQAPL